MGFFEDIWNKNIDKYVFKPFNIDSDPIFTPGFRRFIKWFAYKAMPFVLTIAGFVVMFWFYFRIYDKYGFERVVLVVLLLILISLQRLGGKKTETII